MGAFPPKMPWSELYVRSGLKTFSDRVRQRPLVRKVRGAVDELRTTVQTVARERLPAATATAEQLMRRLLAEQSESATSIVNATGILAPRGFSLPLADTAIAAMSEAAAGYTMRTSTVESQLTKLTGAEAALVVHSPAVAAMAVMAALGDSVVVARDQVCEVDAISLAELADAAHIQLKAVGSIGRVSREDYRAALGNRGAGCLWFARSHSAVILGDVATVPSDEVFALARDSRVPSVEYLEAAALFEIGESQAAKSIPIVGTSLLTGADLVLFAGDRFLGGPRCGIIVGRTELVARVAAHAISRAGVCDAPRLAALQATLQLASDSNQRSMIPAVQLITASAENLLHRAERLAVQLAECSVVATAEVVPNDIGYLNDGRLTEHQVPGCGIGITPAAGTAEALARQLLSQRPSIVATADGTRVLVRLQSVLARQDEQIAAAFQALSPKHTS